MTDQDKPRILATDLPITLYLNQRLTFDMLAILEDGFSQFMVVETASSGETSTEISGGAHLSAGNGLALFGLQLGGRGSRQTGILQAENTTERIVHTPTSLFARLRKELRGNGLVRDFSAEHDPGEVHPGCFIEFEATLQRSPIIELFAAFQQLVPLAGLLNDSRSSKTAQPSKGGKNRGNQATNTGIPNEKQVNSLISAMTAGNSEDLIAKLGDTQVILTTEREFFTDPTMNDVIDGTFHIFGKVTRVIPTDNTDTIGLFRKTPLGKLGNTADMFGEALQGLEEVGFNGKMQTELKGPALQVIPIAIFS